MLVSIPSAVIPCRGKLKKRPWELFDIKVKLKEAIPVVHSVVPEPVTLTSRGKLGKIKFLGTSSGQVNLNSGAQAQQYVFKKILPGET